MDLEVLPNCTRNGKLAYKAWRDPYCESYGNQVVECAGNGGAFRPTSGGAIFFLVSAVATKLVPAINREAWLAKYTVFAFFIFFFDADTECTPLYWRLSLVGMVGCFRLCAIAASHFD